MAHIRKTSHWYIAELVEQIRVEDEAESVVHINFNLIKADSPEEAWAKSLELGKSSEDSYPNPAGKTVRARFRGVRDLNVIHEDLSDGAEILFEEKIGLSDTAIEGLVRAKECLAVFRKRNVSPGPDYSSKQVVKEARKLR